MKQPLKTNRKTVFFPRLKILLEVCELMFAIRSVCRICKESPTITPWGEDVEMRMKNVINRLVIIDVGLSLSACLWHLMITKLKKRYQEPLKK